MAGRNDQNKGGKKNTAADQEQEEVAEVEAKEPERDRRQDQLGNQAIASMISSGAAGAGDGGGGGGGAGLAVREHEEDKEGVDYGGDDDPAPADVSFDEAMLAEAWRPRTRKSEDKPRFAEQMPAEDLPPEDEAWIAAIRAAPAPRLRTADALEALVQPTADVVATSLADWSRGAFEWGPRGVVWRALRRALVPLAPGLLDPHGRVLLSRARSGAVGIAALAASPTLRRSTEPATCAVMLFELELRARKRRLIAHADAAADLFEGSLPIAAQLFAARAPAHGARRDPRPPPLAAVFVIERTLVELVDLVDPEGVLPVLAEAEPEEEDEDPLGLQAVLDAHTGGAPPPAWQTAAVKAAERLAEQAALGRVQLGAAATVIAEVADQWTSGPPREALLGVLGELDAEVNEAMALLVDIARAAQAGAVRPKGLTRGLRRAAKAIGQHRATALRGLATAAAASLPPGARLVPAQEAEPDPLSEAWADQRPLDAVPWLDATLSGWEREAAIALTRLAAGKLGTADALVALVAPAPAEYGDSFALIRDAALLYEGRPDAVDPTPRAERALATRNGLLLAEAALTAMEAHLATGALDAAEAHRATAGVHAYHMGAYAGFSLLARWAPPEEES